MRPRGFLLMMALCAATAPLHAQYGQLIDQAAGQEALTVGAALRLLGTAAGSLAPEASEPDAREALLRLGFTLPAPDERPVTCGELAYLLAQLFDIPASVSYRLLPGPATAFRQLQASGLMPASARSGQGVSGADALLILRRYLESWGGSP
jgi:hypothetical protein